MGKSKVKQGKGKNRGKLTKGMTYVVDTVAEEVDVDGDGVADLVVKHTVTADDKVIVESSTTWFGLEDEVRDAFVASLEKVGLLAEGAELTTTKFREVVKHWRKLTRALGDINDLGDVKASELDD